jgi:amino acid transporter
MAIGSSHDGLEARAGDAEFTSGPGSVFTRRSSGLVREVGAFDTLLYGINAVAIGYVVFVIGAWALYPGASMSLATLATIVAAVAVGITYALLGAAYPRSGGEYVFVSRILHPLVGFVVGLSQAFWQAFYVGINGAFFAKFALAPTAALLGVQTGWAWLGDVGAFFDGRWGIFLGGTACVVVFGSMLMRSSKTFFKVQRVGLFVALASLLLTLVVLLLTAVGAIDFARSFDEVAGAGAYAQVAADAGKDAAFSLTNTANFVIWPAFSILFTVLAVSFGGEIRNVRRSQLIGIPGSMVIGGLIMIAVMVLGQWAIGGDFLRAAVTSEAYTVEAPPFISVFAGIAGGNALLTFLMSLWLLILIPYALGVGIIYSSRAVLAWSLDGVIPAAFSKVSARGHQPVNAVLTVLVVGEICLALYAFTDLLTILSGLLAFGLVFVAVTLAGLLFPYVKRETFESSPAALRVGGIPLITITSAISVVFVCFVGYRAIVDDGFGANTPTSIRMTIAVVAIGALWFLVATALQRRRGTNVTGRFNEIPID